MDEEFIVAVAIAFAAIVVAVVVVTSVFAVAVVFGCNIFYLIEGQAFHITKNR